MKAAALREKTEAEMLEQLQTLRKERLVLRMKRSQGEDIATNRLREIRRTIARVMTVLTEKKGEDK